MTAVTIQLEGLDALRRQLDSFSDRRFRAAVATTLTRVAGQVRQAWRTELQAELDRPTPLTRNAPISTRADATRLRAEVFLRDRLASGGITPAEYIATQEMGGDRRLRKFEQALVAAGAMPAGSRAVPGRGALLDAFGNVRRQQIVQVLNQLGGGALSVGYRQVIGRTTARRQAAAARSGRQYIALPRGNGTLPAGIYTRAGRELRAVFFFVAAVRYRRRTGLADAAKRVADSRLGAEMKRAVDEHLARLAARGAA